MELLKQQLAGLDFDFDGCTLVLDPMINEVMATIKPIIVDIDPGKVKASEKKYPLAFESFPHVLRAFINSASKSVGEITVMNDTVIALMNAPFGKPKRASWKWLVLQLVKVVRWTTKRHGRS